MSDATGISQHAAGSVPDPAHGYCTDDVARALQVDLMHAGRLGWTAVADSARRNLRFLEAAFDDASGTFRNFRSTDGTWLAARGSQDCQGRAMHALGDAAAAPFDHDLAVLAGALFRAALPVARRLTSPRACASVILGCGAVLRAGGADGGPAVPGSLAATYGELALHLAAVLRAGIARQGDANGPGRRRA
jgi:hypothetical protein